LTTNLTQGVDPTQKRWQAAQGWRLTHWESLIDEGNFASLTEIARAEGIDRAYVSRVFKLTRVSPVIVEQALAGKVTMEALMAMGGVLGAAGS